MRFRVIRDLVAHSRFQREFSAVFKFSDEFALDAQQDMAFDAPVIGEIPRRVLDHAHPDIAKVPGTPVSQPGFALVLGGFNLRPVGSAKG